MIRRAQTRASTGVTCLSRPAPARKALAKAHGTGANILAAHRSYRCIKHRPYGSRAAELEAIERFSSPHRVLPRAKEIYQQMVDSLENIDDVAAAREALRAMLNAGAHRA